MKTLNRIFIAWTVLMGFGLAAGVVAYAQKQLNPDSASASNLTAEEAAAHASSGGFWDKVKDNYEAQKKTEAINAGADRALLQKNNTSSSSNSGPATSGSLNTNSEGRKTENPTSSSSGTSNTNTSSSNNTSSNTSSGSQSNSGSSSSSSSTSSKDDDNGDKKKDKKKSSSKKRKVATTANKANDGQNYIYSGATKSSISVIEIKVQARENIVDITDGPPITDLAAFAALYSYFTDEGVDCVAEHDSQAFCDSALTATDLNEDGEVSILDLSAAGAEFAKTL